jgi:outer membrane protein
MHKTLESYTKRAAWVAASAGLAIAAGCANPMERQSAEALRRSVIESAKRETRDAERRPEPVQLSRRPGEVTFPAERMTELDAIGGPAAYSAVQPTMGLDLMGEAGTSFSIALRQAVLASVRQSVEVQSARLNPAIDQAATTQAEAAFDWVFFGDVGWNSTDQPQAVPIVGGFPVGTASSVNQSVEYSTGVRKRLTSGGTFSIAQGQTYSDNKTTGIAFAPDPSNAAFLELGVEQPLLRGFGSDVALAEVRLSENSERRSVHRLKATLIDTVTRTESAYWRLVRARAGLQIAQKNLERGVETRQVVKAREQFDARPAEISDAVATVERRRSAVIRAENELRQASDELKLLINDPELSVGSEVLLLPADNALDQPVTYSLLDSILTAIDNRPEIQEALVGIDDASIRQTVADNARLPLLNLRLQTRFAGLARGAGDAYEDITESQFVDYLAQLNFEQPIGNREAEAGYRRSQLQRMQSTVNYRSVVQRVVLQVKSALRDVQTQYQLIEQTRAARLAAVENLRTLLVLERTVQSLTPDFLNLKFQRQDSLAQAESDELAALTGYNEALARLAGATGTALERSAIKFEVPTGDEALAPADQK